MARAVPAAGSLPPGRYRSLSVKKRLQEAGGLRLQAMPLADVGGKRC